MILQRVVAARSMARDGLSNQEIAGQLRISTVTVKTHINKLFAKTGVCERARAARYAYQHGLVRPPGSSIT